MIPLVAVLSASTVTTTFLQYFSGAYVYFGAFQHLSLQLSIWYFLETYSSNYFSHMYDLWIIGWCAVNSSRTKVRVTHPHFHLSAVSYRKSNKLYLLNYSLSWFSTNWIYRCSLWLKYGILADETTVILVNTVGSTLFLGYFVVFWMFTVNTSAIYRQFFGALLVLGLTLSYTDYYEVNHTKAVEVVGKNE